MNILLLAPQPFYQERGTPIAVDLLLRGLSKMGHQITLLVMSEGEDRTYPNTTLIRSKPPMGTRGLRPGFSLKKLFSDGPFYKTALQLANEQKPDLIHAIEEAAFMAQRISKKTGIPYVFDMDSSIPQQMAEKSRIWNIPGPLLKKIETSAIQSALAVVPVCPALADVAQAAGARSIHLLQDVSLLDESLLPPQPLDRDPVPPGAPVLMYVGNLEVYQGIDLLLESAAAIADETRFRMVVVGGRPDSIAHYQKKAEDLGIGAGTDFWGRKPLAMMGAVFEQADILVSPRIKGVNTPMKLYSYLDSDCAVLATRLQTHTQVIDESMASLADPNVPAFSAALKELVDSPALRARLAARAKSLIQNQYSWPAYYKKLEALYQDISARLPAS